MRTFAATQPYARAKDHFPAEEEAQPAAKSLVHIAEINVATRKSDFAGVIENEDSDRTPEETTVIFGWNEK